MTQFHRTHKSHKYIQTLLGSNVLDGAYWKPRLSNEECAKETLP